MVRPRHHRVELSGLAGANSGGGAGDGAGARQGIHLPELRGTGRLFADRAQIDVRQQSLKPGCRCGTLQHRGRAKDSHPQVWHGSQRAIRPQGVQGAQNDLRPDAVRISQRQSNAPRHVTATHSGKAISVSVTVLSHTATRSASSKRPASITKRSL